MRTILITILVIAGNINMDAQAAKTNANNERVESMRVAFLTQRLDLSTAESEKFWPVYRTYKKQIRRAREAARPSTAIKSMTASEAEAYLEKYSTSRLEIAELERASINELQAIIGANKVLRLLRAEKNFNEKMIKKIKEKRKG